MSLGAVNLGCPRVCATSHRQLHFLSCNVKSSRPTTFHTLDEVESRLLDFQQYYEQIATPFEWKFTKDDLNALLKRIADHENTTLTPAA